MTAARTEAEATIRGILTDLFPDADVWAVPSDAPLADALDIDSMAQIDVVLEIERRTGIHVPDEDIEGLTTIGVAAAYLADHTGHATLDGHD